MQDEVNSPCVSICSLDEEDICIGCYRTAQEITDWTALDNAAKKEVIEKADERARQRFAHKLL